MQVSICDYCLREGKITETELVVLIDSKITVAACKKHESNLVMERNADKNSGPYQEMINMIVENLDKKGNVFSKPKKKKS